MTKEEAIEYLKRTDITVGMEIKTKTAEALEMAIKALEQEPRKGHWIPLGYEDEWWGEVCTCSACGSAMFRNTYCPNCGVEMVNPEESEDEE